MQIMHLPCDAAEYQQCRSEVLLQLHGDGGVRTFSSSAILFISASPAFPSFLSSFLAKLRVLSRAFCSASLKGGAWTGRRIP